MTLNKLSGFTMVEMLITVAVAAVLLTIGVPSFRFVTNSNRVAAEINGLLGDMQFARSEAIKEGIPVTVCVSSDGLTCAGAAVTTWQSGWIVFSDFNADKAVNGADVIMRVQKTFSSTDTFLANNNVGAVTFNREGYANGIANGTRIELHTVPGNNSWTRCLSINLVGNIASQTYNMNTNGFTCQ
jgi:type IV fimbrial biogenesis protein FimT